MSIPVRRADTFISPSWGVIISGEAVDLGGDGWTVRAQLRSFTGKTLINFGVTPGTDVLLGVADFAVGAVTVTTSTVILYASPAATAVLPVSCELPLDVEIEHPTYGPLDDQYRVTIVSELLDAFGEVAPEEIP